MTTQTTLDQRMTGEALFAAEFERRRPALADEPAWLGRLRAEAFEHFTRMGFPNSRNEAWRQTSLAPFLRQPFEASAAFTADDTGDQLRPFLFEAFDAHLLVFVNGRWRPELSRTASLPAGVGVTDLATALRLEPEAVRRHLGRHASDAGEAFVALNTALHTDGAYIHLGPHTRMEQPIHLLYFSTAGGRAPTHDHTRNLIVLEEGARATVIESFAGVEGEVYFSTAVTETILGADAQLDHYVMQEESTAAYHFMRHSIRQADRSDFSTHTISLGGRLVRNEINPVLDGVEIRSTLKGLYMLKDSQHLDNHTRFEHARPHCNSTQVYKGILDDAAHAVFTGRILVQQDAQKTDAIQSSNNLLLSDRAQVNAQPQLEIFADDVRCTHGATIGQLDDDALFYLRARGIERDRAHGLLTFAFANEIIEHIRIEPLRDKLEHIAASRFRKEDGDGEEHGQ